MGNKIIIHKGDIEHIKPKPEEEEEDIIIPTWVYIFSQHWFWVMLLPVVSFGTGIYFSIRADSTFWFLMALIGMLSSDIILFCFCYKAIDEWDRLVG